MNHFKNNHDLRLPDWGPYSKRFFGTSHLADNERGFRFDLAVMPSLYRRKIKVPEALKDAEYSPWECSADLNYYAYRQQIEWKDRLYCDISFNKIDDHTRLVRCEYINNTEYKNSFSLNLFAGIYFPFDDGVSPVLPSGAKWIDAVDYSSLEFAQPDCHNNLSDDGLRRAEIIESATTGKSTCIGNRFGLHNGDRVIYKLPKPTSVQRLILRYRLPENETLSLQCTGYVEAQLTLKGTGAFDTVKIAGTYSDISNLTITSAGGANYSLIA